MVAVDIDRFAVDIDRFAVDNRGQYRPHKSPAKYRFYHHAGDAVDILGDSFVSRKRVTSELLKGSPTPISPFVTLR